MSHVPPATAARRPPFAPRRRDSIPRLKRRCRANAIWMICAVFALGAVLSALPARRVEPSHRPGRRAAERSFSSQGQAAEQRHGRSTAQCVRAMLPFQDQRDFEESRRGFLAAPAYRQIKNEAGAVVWDMGAYDFLLAGQGLRQHPPVAAAPGRAQHGLRPVRGRAGSASTRCAASTSRTSASSRATPAGSSSTRSSRRRRPRRRSHSSTRNSACDRSRRSCTRTRTSITSAACGASSTRPTSAAARCR